VTCEYFSNENDLRLLYIHGQVDCACYHIIRLWFFSIIIQHDINYK
jgi:hypothetical protein